MSVRQEKMIIIIRGVCGVGKTTVSRLLVELIYKGAHIDGDQLVHMSDKTMEEIWRQQGQEGILFLSVWITAVASALVEHGFHPIIDWMYPMDEHLQDLIRRLCPLGQEVNTFNLLVDSKEHLQREGKRLGEITEEAMAMVDHFKKHNHWANSSVGITIDTTGQTPENIAEDICERLGFSTKS